MGKFGNTKLAPKNDAGYMALARMRSVSEQAMPMRVSAVMAGVSPGRVSQAILVLNHAEELVDAATSARVSGRWPLLAC